MEPGSTCLDAILVASYSCMAMRVDLLVKPVT